MPINKGGDGMENVYVYIDFSYVYACVSLHVCLWDIIILFALFSIWSTYFAIMLLGNISTYIRVYIL